MLRIAGIFHYNILFHNPLMSRFAIIEDVLLGVPLGGGWQIRNGQCVSGPLIGRELRSQAADVNQSPAQFMAAILAKAAGR